MLDSMVASSRPTRAEVTDVANAILDGTDAVMLSQESAVGQYPVEAVAMMASIAERTEQTAPVPRVERAPRAPRPPRPRLHARLHAPAARRTSSASPRSSCPTLSGRSARLISAHRPTVPIYALSPGPRDRPPLRADVGRAGGVDAPLRGHRGADRAPPPRAWSSSAGSSRGERVGITAGLPSGRPGTTSLLQIQEV